MFIHMYVSHVRLYDKSDALNQLIETITMLLLLSVMICNKVLYGNLFCEF